MFRGSPPPIADGSVPDTLRFTVTDVNGQAALEEEYGAFRDALAAAIDRPVELVGVEGFVASVPALLNGQVDLALAGPSEYVLLQARTQATPLVAVTRPGYYTVFSTRPDGQIQSLADLKGKAIAITEEGSTASHLGAALVLDAAGLDPLKDVKLVPLRDRQIDALQGGEVAAWADSRTHRARLLSERKLDDDALPIVARGDDLPKDVFVARSGLSSQWLETLRAAMLDNERVLMDAIVSSPANQKYAQSQMVPATDRDYDSIRKAYETVGQASLLR